MRIVLFITICVVLLGCLLSGLSFAETGGTVIREISDPDPEPGETVTVTIYPIGITKYYAVEEHLSRFQYTGEHTADSNPVGTTFTNLTPRSFTYKVRVPLSSEDLAPGEQLAITGEFWTDPDDKEAIGETAFGVPIVYISPPFQEVSPGDPFSVDIDVEPAGLGVSAASVIISFDPGTMRVDSVEIGDFLGGNPILAPGFPKIDNTGGTVRIDAARMGATTVPSVQGTLATIRLTAADETQILKRVNEAKGGTDIGIPAGRWYTGLINNFGTSKLAFTSARLTDENSVHIAEITTVDGAVSIVKAEEIMPEEPDSEDEDRIEKSASEKGECPRWDINQDCIVNDEDLGLLGIVYDRAPQSDYPKADINEDLIVELEDLSLLAAHYKEIGCECSKDMQREIGSIPKNIRSTLHPQLKELPCF